MRSLQCSNTPRSLIEVPIFIPGLSQPIFLLTARRGARSDDVAVARDFISKYPVYGFESAPSDDAESKLAYVLAMMQMVRLHHAVATSCLPPPSRVIQRRTITEYSPGFFSWANEIYHQVPPPPPPMHLVPKQTPHSPIPPPPVRAIKAARKDGAQGVP